MSEQGERNEPRVGEDGDWWSQLYDPGAPDTGGSPAEDTIDDRFASAREVGASAPGRPTEPGIVDPPPAGGSAPTTPEPPADAEAPPERAAWLDRLFGTDPAEDELRSRGDEAGTGDEGDAGPRTARREPVARPREVVAEERDAEDRSADEPPARDVPRTAEDRTAEGRTGSRPDPLTGSEPYGHAGGHSGTPSDEEAAAGADATTAGDATTGEGAATGEAPSPARRAAVGARRRSMREVLGHGGRHGGGSGAARPPRGRLAPPEPGELADAAPGTLSDLVPDTVLDGARHGGLVLRAVSGRGGSARRRGEPRGDALFTARFGTGDAALLFVAVAVGAGAAPAGRRAAREVCQSIGEAVGRSRPRLVEDIAHDRRATLSGGLKRLTDRCYGRLRAQAAALELGPEEYHADLRCLLAPTDPACTTRIVFGAGGGGLFRLRDGSWADLEPEIERAAQPRTGVPARLPDPREPESAEEAAPEPPPFRFRAVAAEPGDALMLCSAGLAVPLRGDPAFADQLAESWSGRAEPPDLASFLTDVQYPAPAYGDDRTAVTLWHATR